MYTQQHYAQVSMGRCVIVAAMVRAGWKVEHRAHLQSQAMAGESVGCALPELIAPRLDSCFNNIKQH